LYLLFVLSVEIFYQIYKRLEPTKEYPVLELTIDEVDERVNGGQSLVILEDLVIDVSSFMNRHPGGTFALKHLIGKDVGKYFFGAYSLEIIENQPTHKHSRIAFNIAKKLAIARLDLQY